MPVMKLDDAISEFELPFINLLSIDVEGLNVEVLKGAKNSLSKTLLLCIEFDFDKDLKTYSEIIGNGFELEKRFGCNAIYINKELKAKFKKQIG
ncbi:MAG: FkbM family methyltransferase [Bacteroidales bacterium]